LIEKVSDAAHDHVANGFVAADSAHELKVPGLELATLMSMEDVTGAMARAAGPGATDAQAAAARQETLARLVQEAQARTGLTCEPVSLYQGGQTWIYAYKIHKDVRLVMAPEYGIAAFGKDWDNFSFPRHDLDFSLFRVYENGLPYHPPHHLAWTGSGPRYGDLTLVVGHPGRTSRLETLAQMEAERDTLIPLRIRSLDRTRKALHAFEATGPEQARLASGVLLGLENSYKVYLNEHVGLKNKDAMEGIQRAEADLRAAVAKDPVLQAQAGPSWDQVAQAMARRCGSAKEDFYVGSRGSRLLDFALNLVGLQLEVAKPAARRQAGYRTDTELEKLRARLRRTAPQAPALEAALFTEALEEARDELGAGHPFVAAVLAGQAPAVAAQALLKATRLQDPAFRTALLEGQPALTLDSTDPMVALARRIEALVQPLRKEREATQAILSEHGARIARARFQVRGTSVYPDATFTLRLSYGAVETYPANGTLVQPFTTFGGLFDRADAWGPEAEDHSWQLPQRWLDRRGKLDPRTHFDFISSNDIIGGNSGSPVLARSGELVGLAFDGNIESNAGRFYFDPRVNRTISVDAGAILAALEQVYDAGWLVNEITRK